jgi:hypothetical protein
MDNPHRLFANILLVILAECCIGSAIYSYFSDMGWTTASPLIGLLIVILLFARVNHAA